MIKVGNAQAFWGDSPGAPARLVSQQKDLDYLTLDYLSEVSMSIMAIQREKDPKAGYAKDFLNVIFSLLPFWKQGRKLRLVSNAGGLNPQECARECRKILDAAGCTHLRIGVVSGDNVLVLLKENPIDPLFQNMETHKQLSTILDNLTTANAYLGAQPVAQALLQGADIVITGRLADPSLTVGPCMAHFGWQPTDYDKIAGATIAGHLIECGTQVTGGISTDWLSIPDPAHIGFPVAEISEDGSCVITKPENTGGRVDIATVKEQLLYEIGNPAEYISPDAVVSFLSLKVEQQEINRVKVSNAKGSQPPDTYKVSATYADGFKTEGALSIFGPQCKAKAELCGKIVIERVKDAGFTLERSLVECIGAGAIALGVHLNNPQPLECLLRISVADPRKEALECFSKEIAGLVTSGPQGVSGYTSGRPHIRPVFGYWPCLVERSKVQNKVEML